MTWQSHVVIGLLTTTIWLQALPLPLSAQAMLLALLGSLAPDLDAPESKIKHLKIPVGGRRGDYLKPLRPVSQTIHELVGHRGILHSLLMIFFLVLGALVLKSTIGGHISFYLAFIMGYFSHIIADSLTVGGVQLLYPSKQHLRLLPRSLSFQTGSLTDWVLFVAAVAGLLGILLIRPDLVSQLTTWI